MQYMFDNLTLDHITCLWMTMHANRYIDDRFDES